MILGIDIGTQSLKVIITDHELNIRSSASVCYDISMTQYGPGEGQVEQDPLGWEKALHTTIASALQKKNISPDSITAIGISGQLDGCIAIGNDGAPLSRALIWMDRRATAIVDRITANGFSQKLREKTGILPDAGHMGAKISWLKENGGLKSQARCFHQPVSYLVSRLTGRDVFDHALASTTMLYSLQEKTWDPELLAAFGIQVEELPEISEGQSVAGKLNALGSQLTGLPQGIPVAVGTGDDFSSLLGAGVVTPGKMICILGTAEVVGALSSTPKIDAHDLVETHPFVSETFFIENPGWSSGGTLTWFQETFGLKSPSEIDTLAEAIKPGSEGLIFIPALSGSMAPEWNANARGCFYGLSPAHGLPHMARAVLEGCAFAMRDVQNRLNEMQISVESILLAGGGAKSTLWAQIRADIAELPVFIADNKDTSPMGAAILAAVATNELKFEEAARLVGHTSNCTQPITSNFEAYRQSYQRYRLLFQSLKPMFNTL